MAKNDSDLWPSDLGLEELPRSPLSILREQAGALSAKLDGKVQARVYSAPIDQFSRSDYRSSNVKAKLRHRMVLVVPSLEDYELDLLNLAHGDDAYPLLAQLRDKEDRSVIHDENALVEWLREAFASQSTRRALSSLLSLA